jgi:hypothetical protein
MNCLRSLEHWDRGFESHSRHGCLCVRLFCVCVVLCVGSGLATGWSPSKESFRLCKNDYETEEEARAQKRSVEPLMNEWMNEWISTDWKTEDLNPAREPSLLCLFQVSLSPLKEINGLFLKIGQCNSHWQTPYKHRRREQTWEKLALLQFCPS